MSFTIGIWDHARYVTDKAHPYNEMARHLERMRKCGVTLTNIYLPEVISLDDYCRAAAQCGMAVEARITPAWADKSVVKRTLPEPLWQEMEQKYGIRLSGPCGNRPDNREKFLNGAKRLAEEYEGRITSLHLDFIRNDNALLLLDYPCQCEVCKALYKRFLGVEVPEKSMLKNPAVLYKILAIRNRNIRRTVEGMKAIASAHHLHLTIAARANYLNTADITAPPVWGLGPAVIEGQDWAEWAEDKLIDAIYPMNYHTEMTLFKQVLADHIRLLEGRSATMLFPGIGVVSSMGINPPGEVEKRLAAVKAAGLPGAMLFNKTNVYSDDYCKIIANMAALH